MEDKQVKRSPITLATPTEGKRVVMLRGLVRAAEAVEEDPNRSQHGKIWDDAMRIGLELAREHGWGKHAIGTIPRDPVSDFQKELEQLINRHSQENGSHTPDFILASYLQSCLDAWNLHTRERDRWFGNRSVVGPGVDDVEYKPVATSEKSLLR